MKKSEAVNQMAGYLTGFPGFTDKHPQDLVALATHVIEGVEKIGMLPPSRMFKSIPWGFQLEWEPDISAPEGKP